MRGVLQRTTGVVVSVAGISAVTWGGVAAAEPERGPEVIAVLIADVARADQRLSDLEMAVHTEQEAVQKALVDVESARAARDQALTAVQVAQRDLELIEGRIAQAQQRFDDFAASMYMNGPSDGVLAATSPDDILGASAADQGFALAFTQTRSELERTQVEQLNAESAARQAQEYADRATRDAEVRYEQAVQKLRDTEGVFARQRADIDRVAQERTKARSLLDAARATPTAAPGSTTDSSSAPAAQEWDTQPFMPAGTARWDTAVPAVPTANFADPAAIVNTVLQISASSAQVTANLGREFLAKLGIIAEPAPAAVAAAPTGQIPRVYGQQAVEYVIRRGATQLGVPYSWGGGNASGATRGIDQGAGTVGFDCSGLMVFAFAGVGIKLPKYSGSQYNLGRRVPVAQMRRGDLIFYGPGGGQHVALYLGQGQMLESPYTGSQVRVAPVRTSGMTTHVVRLVEY